VWCTVFKQIMFTCWSLGLCVYHRNIYLINVRVVKPAEWVSFYRIYCSILLFVCFCKQVVVTGKIPQSWDPNNLPIEQSTFDVISV
jgi:hypothetical protein